MRPVTVAILTMTFVLSGPVSGADFSELLAQCEGCHGPAGVSAHGDVPTIAGQDAIYIEKTLRSFQIWGRPCIKSNYRFGDTSRPRTDMCQVAEGLTGEDIKALSAHFGELPFKAAIQDFDPDLAASGAVLHQQHCERCHEQGGTVPNRSPRLAGQWQPYLQKAMKFVPTGEHLVPPAMESRITDLGQNDIDALMNYYASQQN